MTIDIDTLLGNRAPLQHFALNGQSYPLVLPDDLPELFYIRRLKAADAIQSIYREVMGEVWDKVAGESEAPPSDRLKAEGVPEGEISRMFSIIAVRIVQPMREQLEATLQMEPGTLASQPASVVQALREKVEELLAAEAQPANPTKAGKPAAKGAA